jgi:beta-galactosidase
MMTTKFKHLLHGGDYNPEQWRDYPGVWQEDLRLFNLAHINTATIGIFSWAELEPEEGRFEFGWLDEVIDGLTKNGQRFILATPSGAKPNWLALKYEEVRRCDEQGRREPQRDRHNHCWTSPVYREKVRIINTKLAERYGKHPGLLLWHISNELNGRCYCPLCFQAFRAWLQARYGTVEKMNAAFWSKFWSHTFRSFDEVTNIDATVHGLDLAWKRFTSDQIVSFVRAEIEPLRQFSPGVPVTTNMMYTYPGINSWELARVLDLVSWDNYPFWGNDVGDETHAQNVSFMHDIYRSFKDGQPFVMMETTPSQINWARASPLKRPGMHRLGCLHAVAHGADGVLYFQLRKSRGSCEKYHGAVIDHAGHEHTRVFREVAALGADLEKLAGVAGGRTRAEAAIMYDWENGWIIDQAQLMRNANKDYTPTCSDHYRPFWRRGVAVDVTDGTQDWSRYKLVVAPMLHMVRPGVAERITEFVRNGGVFVTTYLSGWVNEEDLCFLGGFPGPLRKVLGIWVEETDALDDKQQRTIVPVAGNPLGLPGQSLARHFCDLVHLEGAEALATYGDDFYAGTPAVTVNRFGKGRAYYVASRNDDAFLDAMFGTLIRDVKPARALEADLPPGVTAQHREQSGRRYVFLMNFQAGPQQVQLGSAVYQDALTGQAVQGQVVIPGRGVVVLVASMPGG